MNGGDVFYFLAIGVVLIVVSLITAIVEKEL
jgi:hypothetical protein